MNILLIEKNSKQQSLLTEQLCSLGHEVTLCTDTETALKMYHQAPYSLIILDLEHAEHDGIQLCRQIRSLPKGNRAMILVIHRSDHMKNIEAAIEAGADNYLLKPVQVEHLKIRLTALERQLLHFTQLKVKTKYLTGIFRVMQNTKQLTVREKDYYRLLQNVCDTLTETQGVLSAQIKLIDQSGILVKIAESISNQEFTFLPEQEELDLPGKVDLAPLQGSVARNHINNSEGMGTTEGEKITAWLEYAGKCYGLLTVFLSNILTSNEEERSFLNEVAANIASALYGIEIEKKSRRTEKALQESRARYRELGDSITDLFFAFDNNLRIIYWNRASENLTGVSMKNILGKSIYDIFPEIRGTEAEGEYLEAVKTQTSRSFIQTYQLKGKTSFFEVNIYPSQDGFSVFAKNVTYRKQMEDALKKSWDYLENLNNSMGDAIFTVKMPELLIEYVNRAVENIFGYTLEECIGKHTRMFFPDEERYLDFSQKLGKAITQKKEILRTEQVLKRKDGEHFTSEITTTFLNEDNEVTGIISIVRDITDRKQMELALKQERTSLARKVEKRTAELRRINTKLARASRLKDEFLANMSHELRTPLNAILGYAKILKKTNNLSQLQVEGLDTIRNSGEHLLTLISDILDLSKIEAGRLDLHVKEFHLPEFLQQIANIIRIRAEQKEISFVYKHDPDLPIGVLADEKRLREVLFNLLDNAVKFTEKGSVTFRVKRKKPKAESQRSKVKGRKSKVERENSETTSIQHPAPSTQHPAPSTQHPASSIQFQVKDTGIGIAPEELKEIFLPFRQVGKQRFSTEGTGLGLAISQQLVKMMGGKLKVKSVVEKGSTFWFDLDMPEIEDFYQKTHLQQPEIIGYNGAQRTIMIVDDKQENRAILMNMLVPLGFEILEATNGQECLDTIMDGKPDLILLDLRMPVLDGFETAKRIRKIPKIRDIRIIAISASAFEETRKKSLGSGCDDFLSKPIEAEHLLTCLQTHLKLEWVYRDDSEGEIPNDASISTLLTSKISLPLEEVNMLRKLAGYGNITRLLNQLERIEQLGDQYLPLVIELRKFAKSFQIHKIVDLLEHLENTHEG